MIGGKYLQYSRNKVYGEKFSWAFYLVLMLSCYLKALHSTLIDTWNRNRFPDLLLISLSLIRTRATWLLCCPWSQFIYFVSIFWFRVAIANHVFNTNELSPIVIYNERLSKHKCAYYSINNARRRRNKLPDVAFNKINFS
jgi:hypothetical protein